MQCDFRRFQVSFHRNGIAGEAFYLCRFLYVPTEQDLQAVVFDGGGQVAVTSEDIRERWRGDDFEPALRAAIAAVERAQPETMYAKLPDHAA